MKKFTLFFLQIFFLISVYAQAFEEERVLYTPDYQFEDGLYLSFEDFKYSQPMQLYPLVKQGDELYSMHQSDSLDKVEPEKVWGYALDNSVYISLNGAYWKLINIGSLTHFTKITVISYYTTDAFGFPTEMRERQLNHYFIDMETGEIRELSNKEIAQYIEKDQMLKKAIKKSKTSSGVRGSRSKFNQLLYKLNAYNQFHPLYFPVNE